MTVLEVSFAKVSLEYKKYVEAKKPPIILNVAKIKQTKDSKICKKSIFFLYSVLIHFRVE